jgi:hypothetical protein
MQKSMSRDLRKALISHLTPEQLDYYNENERKDAILCEIYDDFGPDSGSQTHCICGVQISNLFYCANNFTGERLTIGSECILRFGKKGEEFIKIINKKKRMFKKCIEKIKTIINGEIKNKIFMDWKYYSKFLKLQRIIECGNYIVNEKFISKNYGVINIMPLEMQLEIKEKIKSSQRKIEYPTSNRMQLEYIMKPLGYHLNEM